MRILPTLLLLTSTGALDRFNYDRTQGNNYGPKDWGRVDCHDVATCPGWPTNWDELNPFIPYHGTENMCRDCSRQGSCNKRHQQSPIDLDRSIIHSRVCHDRHLMTIVRGTCPFEEYRFEILPHVLRVYHKGEDTCGVDPNIDFSMGFPNPWMLSFTDVSVPSQHTQNGRRYDAELVLSHVYSRDVEDRLIGNVAVMLEKGTKEDHYDFLQLYIDRWKEEEAKVARLCRHRLGQSLSNEDPEPQRDLLTNKSLDRLLGRRFHPYDPYKYCNTEYYFRYEGSMPEPPCFEGVHWRVMKDPITVSPDQIHALEQLIARRLDPSTCQLDTVGKPRQFSTAVDVNRPLQARSNGHKLVFCECGDWESASEADQEWCQLPVEARLSTPTLMPSHAPSSTPTGSPSSAPSDAPTAWPSVVPTSMPSSKPTGTPSDVPSEMPSSAPFDQAPSLKPPQLGLAVVFGAVSVMLVATVALRKYTERKNRV